MESEHGARFSPRLTKSKAFCSVYGCFTRAWKEPTVRFHRFPKPAEGYVDVTDKSGVVTKVDKLQAWKIALKVGKEISSSMKVCSLHFKKEDYILPDAPSRRRCLKKSAVPSCNVPKGWPRAERITVHKGSCKKVLKRDECNNGNRGNPEIVYINVESFREARLIGTEQDYPPLVDAGTASAERSDALKLCNLIKTNQQLRALTGIESFEILKRIVNVVKIVYPEKAEVGTNLEVDIIMTFMKLKQNLSYKTLAIMCGINNSQNCQKIFYATLELLSQCLKTAIYWPTKTEIFCNIPKSFRGFEGIRVILDSTEVRIEKSKKLNYRVQSYSHWKRDYTIKFVTGFTPVGFISFISMPYGGRTSHKVAFENCNVIEKLDRHDFMMLDERFITNDACSVEKTNFIARISYVKGQKKLPVSYAMVTSMGSEMRDCIKKMKRRIKSFKIFDGRIPAELVERSKDILIVICATLNMSSPILKEYKFEL